MEKKFKVTVVVPGSYLQSTKRYSVIYLLHGFGGDHTIWPRITNLKQDADSLQILFVCPDGDNSWYLDSPVREKCLFETYIIHELIPFIDSYYRTFPQSEGRAIMGMSMGGHGAVSLLAKHPDVFSGSCSIAGIMDLTEFPYEWNLPGILGPLAEKRQAWIYESCIHLTDKLKNISRFIILECGSEDFALKGNRKEDSILLKAGITHFFYSQHGTHDLHYVSVTAPRYIVLLSEKLLTSR